LFDHCTSLTSVTIPSSVIRIAEGAFSNCTGLTSITIPAGVTSIGAAWCADFCTPLSAFSGCINLNRAVFLGDSPYLYTPDFEGAAPGFTIYCLTDRVGFTSPTWNGHPTIMIDKATYPAAPWLLEHELWYDTDLHQDTDGDGVSLLMAYALDLDPRLNLRSSLPVPVIDGNTMSLSFHATSPGITYRVETSTDLKNWTTAGVTRSVPGADERSIATVPLGASSRFLRLAVED
jgi:BspA type Leucine rich repeat region (6 copies)